MAALTRVHHDHSMDHTGRLSQNRSAARRALWIVAGLLFAVCPVLRAQQTPEAGAKPVVPEGPLIQKHAPDFASWIIIEGAPAAVKERLQPSSNSSRKQDAQTASQKITFVKTGDILHVEMPQDENHVWNIWNKGDLKVVVWPDGKNVGFAYKPSNPSDLNPLYIDGSKSDFPGFEWISADNYTGTGSMGGKTCLIFETTIRSSSDPAVGNGLSDHNIAYVDQETRLPVALSNRSGVKMYQFLPPPAVMLVMPPEVQTFVEKEKAKIEMLARHSNVAY